MEFARVTCMERLRDCHTVLGPICLLAAMLSGLPGKTPDSVTSQHFASQAAFPEHLVDVVRSRLKGNVP